MSILYVLTLLQFLNYNKLKGGKVWLCFKNSTKYINKIWKIKHISKINCAYSHITLLHYIHAYILFMGHRWQLSRVNPGSEIRNCSWQAWGRIEPGPMYQPCARQKLNHCAITLACGIIFKLIFPLKKKTQ